MSTKMINGVRHYYELHGDSGESLVLVHGYTGDITDWRLQIREFSPTYRVLVMDLRGHGRTEAPADRSTYTIPQMSLDVEALVDEVGFDKYHLVGHSMGGGIVQEIALRSPHRLLSLTLHDTSLKFDMSVDDVMAEWREKRLSLAKSEGMAAVVALPPPFPSPPHMPPERIEETNLRLSRMSVDAFLGAWRGLVDWEGTAKRAAAISTPTLIIYGDLDAPALIEASLMLAKLIPQATVEVIPEAAHSPQWERPDLYNQALRRHLEANRAAGEG